MVFLSSKGQGRGQRQGSGIGTLGYFGWQQHVATARTIVDVDHVQSCHWVDGEGVVEVHEPLVRDAHVVAVLGPKDSLTQRVRGAIRADIGIVQPQIIYVLLQLLRSTV